MVGIDRALPPASALARSFFAGNQLLRGRDFYFQPLTQQGYLAQELLTYVSCVRSRSCPFGPLLGAPWGMGAGSAAAWGSACSAPAAALTRLLLRVMPAPRDAPHCRRGAVQPPPARGGRRPRSLIVFRSKGAGGRRAARTLVPGGRAALPAAPSLADLWRMAAGAPVYDARGDASHREPERVEPRALW